MTLFDLSQLLGGILLALGYIPQIIQIKTTHSCRDLNPKTYLTIFVGVCLMEVYAINLWLNGSGYMVKKLTSIVSYPEHGIVEITKGVALRHPFCYMILIIILEIIIICGIIIV